MLHSVFGKAVWDRRRGLLWWLGGLLFLALLTVSFWPSIEADSESFVQLFETLPQGFLAAFGVEDAAALVTPVGLVNSRIYGSIGTLIAIFFAVSMGTQAIAGEEDRRTLDMLLANPISRTRVLVEKWLAMVSLTAVLALALLVLIAIANPAFGLEFTVGGMVAANVGLALIAILFGTLALFVGALSGRRSLTIGATTGCAIAVFFVNSLAPLVDSIAWTQKLSPFYWFLGNTPLGNGFAAPMLLLPALTGVLLLGAIVLFRNRDVQV